MRKLHEVVELILETSSEDPFIEVFVDIIYGNDTDTCVTTEVMSVTDRCFLDITHLPHYQFYKDWYVKMVNYSANTCISICIQPTEDCEYYNISTD